MVSSSVPDIDNSFIKSNAAFRLTCNSLELRFIHLPIFIFFISIISQFLNYKFNIGSIVYISFIIFFLNWVLQLYAILEYWRRLNQSNEPCKTNERDISLLFQLLHSRTFQTRILPNYLFHVMIPQTPLPEILSLRRGRLMWVRRINCQRFEQSDWGFFEYFVNFETRICKVWMLFEQQRWIFPLPK